MNSDFPHPGIALFIGFVMLIIPVLSVAKGTVLFIGFQKKSERPAFFWLGVVIWCLIIGIILIGSGRELSKRNQERSSNNEANRTSYLGPVA